MSSHQRKYAAFGLSTEDFHVEIDLAHLTLSLIDAHKVSDKVGQQVKSLVSFIYYCFNVFYQ